MPAAPLNPQLASTLAPPVMAARRWLAETRLPEGVPLLNLSQAAPADPPPEPLRRAMADALAAGGEAHLYGAVLGDPELRAAIARVWSSDYRAEIAAEQVAVTAGCNQAFCAAIATLCGPGDAVLLPVPWYFNHKMWLDICGIRAVPIPPGPGLRPDLGAVRAALTPKVRALALVSPNNPTGVDSTPDELGAAFDLCAEAGIALVLDETYRDFRSAEGPAHGLFARAGWEETLVHLYSFSKVYRLTGHRTGAMLTGAARLAEAEKFLDTVAICPPRTGQIAALAGLRALGPWVADERAEVLTRRAALEAGLAALPGWRCLGAGAYFAWVETEVAPELSSTALAKALLAERGVLALPSAMFGPEAGPAAPSRALRLAFANVDRAGIADLLGRLRGWRA